MTEQQWLTSVNPALMLESQYREWEKGGSYFAGLLDGDLRAWVEECRRRVGGGRNWCNLDNDLYGSVWVWARECEGYDDILPKSQRAALLRCCAGNPFRPGPARQKCPDCRGTGDETNDGQGRCSRCLGKGWLKSPFVTPDVLALVTEVRDKGSWKLRGVLTEALEDAGCPEEVACPNSLPAAEMQTLVRHKMGIAEDCPLCKGLGKVGNPLLQHLREQGPHCGHCHVLRSLLGVWGRME